MPGTKEQDNHSTYTAFAGTRRIANGSLMAVALKVKHHHEHHPSEGILTFDDGTGRTVELDLRGTPEDVRRRLQVASSPIEEKKPGPGRPKLGVVSREISLLPRHWDWLSSQPGGASVTLRKLVEEAKKKNQEQDKTRLSVEATYRFMTTMAGDLPGYEEALRALYAKDRRKFRECISDWPKDIREHVVKMTEK